MESTTLRDCADSWVNLDEVESLDSPRAAVVPSRIAQPPARPLSLSATALANSVALLIAPRATAATWFAANVAELAGEANDDRLEMGRRPGVALYTPKREGSSVGPRPPHLVKAELSPDFNPGPQRVGGRRDGKKCGRRDQHGGGRRRAAAFRLRGRAAALGGQPGGIAGGAAERAPAKEAFMVSDFMCKRHGSLRLSPEEAKKKLKLPEKTRAIIQAGKNKDGWWKSSDMVKQLKKHCQFSRLCCSTALEPPVDRRHGRQAAGEGRRAQGKGREAVEGRRRRRDRGQDGPRTWGTTNRITPLETRQSKGSFPLPPSKPAN
ncbi:MAG: hypothetical protein BJ554DRAFT_5872 [Olpidium bornovanus]|uniref:Uncharacterized protein n=1 Tax=Olpidium bornovanus TaxID=278681 RepID=A0A8H8DKN7_9FUNG|nr:MAG: hypothetical protein BJ554DRAFT_5872 [Olpidium bornovanus]